MIMRYLVMVLSLALGLTSLNAQSQNEHLNLKKGLAIQGYDPVSYFKSNKAIEGIKEIQVKHNGATFYFSSNENRNLFIKSPDKYSPEYGGYCAYAMADGDKVKIDPKTFKLIDNKLYLFYNFRGTNTLELWNDDESKLLPKADSEWSKIITN